MQSASVTGQEVDNAYKTFELGINNSFDVSQNMFHDYWEQDIALGFQFRTPFYFGYIEALGDFFSYNGIGKGTVDDMAPDFINIFFVAGWGYKYWISPSLEVSGGLFIGNSMMSFEYQSFFRDFSQLESEITTGLNLNVSYHFSDNWLFRVGARQTRMFTYHRINLSHISIGVSRKVKSPVWLQNFFQ